MSLKDGTLSFNADDEYVSLPSFNIQENTDSFLPKLSFTVSFWLKLYQAPTSSSTIFSFEVRYLSLIFLKFKKRTELRSLPPFLFHLILEFPLLRDLFLLLVL